VLKAMFLREAGPRKLAAPDRGISIPIALGTVVVVVFGLMPASLMSIMQGAAVPMLTDPVAAPPADPATAKARPPGPKPPVIAVPGPLPQMKAMGKGAFLKGQGAAAKGKGAFIKGKGAAPKGKGAAAKGKGGAAKGGAPLTKPGTAPEAKTPAPAKTG
jgi:hypothetical protein